MPKIPKKPVPTKKLTSLEKGRGLCTNEQMRTISDVCDVLLEEHGITTRMLAGGVNRIIYGDRVFS
jgi:hypothetical protein